MAAKPRLEIIVDADKVTKTVRLQLKFPDETLDYKGGLDSLRSMVESGVSEFGPFLGEGGLQDLRVDLRRILLAIEKEFGEKTENLS